MPYAVQQGEIETVSVRFPFPARGCEYGCAQSKPTGPFVGAVHHAQWHSPEAVVIDAVGQGSRRGIRGVGIYTRSVVATVLDEDVGWAVRPAPPPSGQRPAPRLGACRHR
jgi:hypothetical protein